MNTQQLRLALRRFHAWRRVRNLENDLATNRNAALYVHDAAALASMIQTREKISRELAVARANWAALHPPGERFVWRDA